MSASEAKAHVCDIGNLDKGAKLDGIRKAESEAEGPGPAAGVSDACFDETPTSPASLVCEFRKANRIVEVAVCGMDYDKKLLTGVDGRVYIEPAPNLWADLGDPESPVVYVGTGKHGGGIMLSPLYVNVNGTWRHALSGEEVPQSTLARLGRR